MRPQDQDLPRQPSFLHERTRLVNLALDGPVQIPVSPARRMLFGDIQAVPRWPNLSHPRVRRLGVTNAPALR